MSLPVTPTLTAARRVLRAAENTLGYTPYSAKRDAATLLRAMQDKPRLYSEANLYLAIELLRRQRKAISKISALCLYVEQALQVAAEPEVVTPLGDRVERAIAFEQDHQGADWEYWLTRLVRSQGDARADVLTEWQIARRLVSS